MLYDNIAIQDVVDSEAALEFMKEATKLASSSDLEDIGLRLEKKSRLFAELLAEGRISELSESEFRVLIETIFSIKRKANRILKSIGIETLREKLATLLYGTDSVEQRFNEFCKSLESLDTAKQVNLTSELLHFSNPKKYWLWTNWIWDSNTNSGALPLVVQDGIDLHGPSAGEIYYKIGKTVNLVNAMGHGIGFSSSGRGLFGTDIFLACVYAVYMYTVFRVKLSQEFNRILPELTELTQRILGVKSMEINY